MTLGVRFALGGAVATALLFQASLILGPVGALLNLVTPLPAAYAQMRAGTQAGLLAVLMATIGIALLGNIEAAASFVLQYGIIALMLPLLLRRGISWGSSAALTAAVVAIVGLPMLGSFTLLQGQTVSSTITAEVDRNISQALEVYREQGFTEQQLDELKATISKMGQFMARAYFGLSTVWVGISVLLLVAMLRKAGDKLYQIRGSEFWQLRLPDLLIWPLIAAGSAMLVPVDEIKHIALNLLVILLPLYFLQGLAVVSAWFRTRRVAPALRALGYTLILILNPIPLIIMGVGVFDMWVDFRKFNKKKP